MIDATAAGTLPPALYHVIAGFNERISRLETNRRRRAARRNARAIAEPHPDLFHPMTEPLPPVRRHSAADTDRDVAGVLALIAGRDGACWVSVQTIVDRLAGSTRPACERTVQYALARILRAGLWRRVQIKRGAPFYVLGSLNDDEAAAALQAAKARRYDHQSPTDRPRQEQPMGEHKPRETHAAGYGANRPAAKKAKLHPLLLPQTPTLFATLTSGDDPVEVKPAPKPKPEPSPIWTQSKDLLGALLRDKAQAGRLLGMLKKQLPEAEVVDLVRQCDTLRPFDPRSWLLGAARARTQRRDPCRPAGLRVTDPPEVWQAAMGGKLERTRDGGEALALRGVYVDRLACDLLDAFGGDTSRAWDWITMLRWLDDGIGDDAILAAVSAQAASMRRRGEHADSIQTLRFFDRAVREQWGKRNPRNRA